MTEKEKIEAISEILEMEIDDIKRDVVLDSLDTWDSVAVLSVIAVMNDRFNRYPLADEIVKYETIGDLMDAMTE